MSVGLNGRAVESSCHVPGQEVPDAAHRVVHLLVQYRGPADPETGGTFTVKRYSSEKEGRKEADWRHTKVTLSPTNPEYSPIILSRGEADSVQVVAEFVTVLKGAG